MKKMVMIGVVALTAMVFAVTSVAAEDQPDGGMVMVNSKGKVAVVDATGANDGPIDAACKKLSNFLMIVTEAQKGEWSMAKATDAFAKTGANAAVFVVKDPAMPLSLIAMESRWGVVNATELSSESVEKEIIRVAAVLLGGASSKYPASIMKPVFTPQELEAAGSLVTIDTLMAIFPNLDKYGFKQFEMMSYRDACEDGVAPEPVNDVQRRIRAEYKK